MINDAHVTVIGNVVADPEIRIGASGHPFTTFRIASTIRRQRSDGKGYEDVRTNFYSVIAFRNLARNTAVALRKGQSVLVYGRQNIHTYPRADGSTGTQIEIDAISVGHDLCLGHSELTKGVAPSAIEDDRLQDPAVREQRRTAWGTNHEAGEGETESGAASQVGNDADTTRTSQPPGSAGREGDGAGAWRTDYQEVETLTEESTQVDRAEAGQLVGG